MLITFKSRASADVTMLVDTAKYILGVLGKHLGERGVITAAEVPDALARLDAAIEAGKKHDEMLRHNGSAALHHSERDTHPEVIRIDQRAWPIREMLRESRDANADVMWGV